MAEPLPQLSFTTYHTGKVNQLVNQVYVSLPVRVDAKIDKIPDPHLQVNAIWDTGATASVITQHVADKLGLIPSGQEYVNGVNGRRLANSYMVSFTLPNRVVIPIVKVTSSLLLGNNINALIGMDIISQGDFAITHKDGNTSFSFTCPPSAHIDFINLADSYLYPENMNRANRRKNDKISKKSFKRNRKFKRNK